MNECAVDGGVAVFAAVGSSYLNCLVVVVVRPWQ